MKAWIQKKALTLSLIVAFLLGLALLLYPSISDYWNSFHQSQVIMDYSKSVSQIDTETYDKLLESAKGYNAEKGMDWNFSQADRERYNQELNFNADGTMGYIEIPKIGVQLSMFHGTDESILETSIGHLEGTSLPVGGEGTHSVLSGHRGLPSAKLFSDLDKLREGDTFTLHVLNETLTYKVDQIRVVEPTDLSTLVIEEGMDYCTLVTCTPYAINSHRLLVRGHRVDNLDGDAKIRADAIQIKPIFIAPFITIPILFLMVIYILVVTSPKRQHKRQEAKVYLMNRLTTKG